MPEYGQRRRKIPSGLFLRQGWQRRVTRGIGIVFLAYNHGRMSREIVINATRHESRIAVLDEGQVVELWVERTRHRTIVGNIYKGRVTKVLPGMQSAFVDLGLERDAFLYVSDVIEDLEEYETETPDELHIDDVPQHRPEASISDLLREGQEIVVQVSKDTIAGTGARFHSHITLQRS